MIYHCHRCGSDYGGPIRSKGYRLRVCNACHQIGDPGWIKKGFVVLVLGMLLLGCSTAPEPTFDTDRGAMTASEIEALGIGIDGHKMRRGRGDQIFFLADSPVAGDTIWTTNLDSLLGVLTWKRRGL